VIASDGIDRDGFAGGGLFTAATNRAFLLTLLTISYKVVSIGVHLVLVFISAMIADSPAHGPR
jgi:hypothetical protein